jgi:hypothetical protein
MIPVATNVLRYGPMLTLVQNKLIVFPGLSQFHIPALPVIAEEFGWAVETVTDLRQAMAIHSDVSAAAVFFHREAFGPDCSWTDALRVLSAALPGTRLIPCHGFSEQVDWSELSDAGAFHFLWLPLKENEVRQCLGFVWETRKELPELLNNQLETPLKRFPSRSLTAVQPALPERADQVPAIKFKYSAA